MRLRQPNHPNGGDAASTDGTGSSSSSSHVKALINSNDLLSTREQEEVIAHFARSMRTTNRFLIVVAGMHVLLAVVYVLLLASGSPLVSTSYDGEQRDALRTATARLRTEQQQRQQQKLTLHGGAGETGSNNNAAAANLGHLEKARRATDQEKILKFLASRTGQLGTGGGKGSSSSSSSLVSSGSAAAMLASAALLFLAGYGCFRAFLVMRAGCSEEELEQQQERRQQEKAVGAVHGGGGDREDTNESKASSGGTGAKLSSRARSSWERTSRRIRREAPLAAQPRLQFAAAALAVLPTLYWLAATVITRRETAALYGLLGGGDDSAVPFLTSGGVPSGLTENLLEALLMVWQPFFHTGIGLMLASLYDGRAQLLTLAGLKYGYEKV